MAFIKGLISKKSNGCLKIAFTCMILLSAVSCTSDNKPVKVSSVVEDPVEIKLKGISNSVLQTNAEAYLSTLPPISKVKARLYGRDITEKVTQALHTYGYYHPKIKITYPKKDEKFNTSVLVDVDPGKPLFIRNCDVEITGDGANYDSFNRIVEKSGVKTYSILDHSRYKKLKEDLLSRAFDMGFFDAKLTESRILVYQEQNAADVQIVLRTGRRYKFGEVKANDSTKELMKPSMSLVNFNPTTDYSSKTISDFSQSLSQTGFYKSVDVRPLVEERKDQSVPVFIDLEKQSSNMFRVGAGYSTDERVRGILGWDKPMINDRGHSLSSFIRASTVKIDAQTVYKIPHKNPNLDYFFIKLAQTHTDYNDTLSDLSHVSFHYTAYMTGSWRRDYYLSLEYEDYTQGDEKGHSVNFIPGVTISRRSTTGGLLPSAGYSVTFDNRFGTRAITDLNFWHSELTIKGAFATTENTRLL
ncbi:MAG: autotransporter assembly complex family protein, partial [Succinivibrio sp.]